MFSKKRKSSIALRQGALGYGLPFYKPVILCALTVFVLNGVSFAQPRYLVPYRDGKLWGYADTNRRVVVTPQYDLANTFWYGYAVVQKDNLYGVLNGNAKEVIPTAYTKLDECCYTYVIVHKGDSTGLIELPSGKTLLQPVYKKIRAVYDAFYTVTDQTSRSGLINLKTGEWVLPMAYAIEDDQYPWFKAWNVDTTFYFKVENDKMVMGVPTAPIVAQPIDDSIPPAVEVLADGNTSASYHVTPTYDSYEIPRGMGWLYIVSKRGKYGVYSLGTYKEIVPLEYDKVEAVPNAAFKEYFIVTKGGKTGVITGNKEVVPLRYEEVRAVDSSVFNDFYIVKLNGKYGIVKGRQQVVPCAYDNAYAWNRDGASFILYKNNKQGAFVYRRHKGLTDILIEPQYDTITGWIVLQHNNFNPAIPYQKGYTTNQLIIQVYNDGKRGFIDEKGRAFFKD